MYDRSTPHGWMIFGDILFLVIVITISGMGGRCSGNLEMCQKICDDKKAIVNLKDGTCKCVLQETEVPITKIVDPPTGSEQLVCEE